jgi:hypothetical protein
MRLRGVLFASLAVLGGCGAGPDLDRGNKIHAMMLKLTDDSQYYITMNRYGAEGIGPPSSLANIEVGVPTKIDASFVDRRDVLVDSLFVQAEEFELRIAADGDPALVTFEADPWQTHQYAQPSGTIVRHSPAEIRITVMLWHRAQHHADFGPFYAVLPAYP